MCMKAGRPSLIPIGMRICRSCTLLLCEDCNTFACTNCVRNLSYPIDFECEECGYDVSSTKNRALRQRVVQVVRTSFVEQEGAHGHWKLAGKMEPELYRCLGAKLHQYIAVFKSKDAKRTST